MARLWAAMPFFTVVVLSVIVYRPDASRFALLMTILARLRLHTSSLAELKMPRLLLKSR